MERKKITGSIPYFPLILRKSGKIILLAESKGDSVFTGTKFRQNKEPIVPVKKLLLISNNSFPVPICTHLSTSSSHKHCTPTLPMNKSSPATPLSTQAIPTGSRVTHFRERTQCLSETLLRFCLSHNQTLECKNFSALIQIFSH